VSSLALVSLCKPPCRAGGWCLTDAAAAATVAAHARTMLDMNTH
jgi:hypothetical protein